MTKLNILLLPLISGSLLLLILPPFNFSYLLWLGLIPLFISLSDDKKYKDILVISFIFSSLYAGKSIFPLLSLNTWGWMENSDIYKIKEIALSIFFIAIIIINGFLFSIFCFIFNKINKNKIGILFIPVTWTIVEIIKTKILFGLSWGNLGYYSYSHINFSKISETTGIYGLSFLIVLINFIIFKIFYSLYKKEKGVGVYIYSLFLLILITSINLIGNLNYKNSANDLSLLKNRLSVVMIKPKDNGKNPVDEKDIINKIINSTGSNPDIIITPESAFPSIILDEETKEPIYKNEKKEDSFYKISQVSKDNEKISFILGMSTFSKGNNYSSIVILEKGEIKDIYNKRRLNPFVEKPISFLFNKTTRPLAEGNKDFLKIKENIYIIPLICSEILNPTITKEKKISFIVNTGNEGVLSDPLATEQNHIAAKMLAISENKYVIRNVKNGISTIINPLGEEIVISKNKLGDVIHSEVKI